MGFYLFIYFMSFYFGLHYLRELLHAENKQLSVRNSCSNFCIATDLNLFCTF